MQEPNPEIFSNNKWTILKEIAKSEQTPTELTEKTGTSLSNIIQQLKLLEAYNIVKKERSQERNYGGKPKTVYSLNEEFVYAVMLKNGKAEKRVFKIEGITTVLFNALFTANIEDVLFILKFNTKNEDILKKCKAIGFIKSSKESIELFLITDHVDEIRAKFSNIFIDDGSGKTKKIINWTHNEFEINDGLNRKDKYFMDMLKNAQVLYDPQSILLRAKEKRDST